MTKIGDVGLKRWYAVGLYDDGPRVAIWASSAKTARATYASFYVSVDEPEGDAWLARPRPTENDWINAGYSPPCSDDEGPE